MKISLITLGALVAPALAKVYYAGVAESGGEFGVWNDNGVGRGLPGRFGSDYAFINKTAIDVMIRDDKINLFRIAFLLERICPPSVGLGKVFNETYFDLFYDAVQYVTVRKRRYALLDPHNYMRYNDPFGQPYSGGIIGDVNDPNAASTEDFKIFFTELAKRFRHNTRVIFGIMNEPHDMPTSLVLKNNQAAIDGIRSTGAKQMILAPANAWSGGHAFTTGNGNEPSSDYLHLMKDPLNNTAIEIHEYLDDNYSGSGANCTQPVTRLDGVTNWLKQHGLKGIITEFGGGVNPGCAKALTDYITYLEEKEVWIGWTAWAAGPLWGYWSPCCQSGQALGSFEPGSRARDGGPGLYDLLWVPVLRPLVPKNLGTHGISSVNGTTD
ncbi:hypothetical protein TWF718_005266 [Orbilia javanica]|uniref:cellulase n=1 Tax=Orbilia javanica TaxID=47235 RepID=A0AAN8RDG0_9PEZI